MNKKGVELTFNAIIIAIICLVALVVIILIFTNFMSKGVEDFHGIAGCQNMGNGRGSCKTESQEDMSCMYRYGGCGGEGTDGDYCCWPK